MNKVVKSLVTLMLLFSFQRSTLANEAGCTVKKDNRVDDFTDLSVSSCTDYYDSSHICSREYRPSFCRTQDMFRAVDWGTTTRS